MKSLFLNNWEAKLVSILVATILWFLIKKNIDTTSTSPSKPTAGSVAR